jgi:hypothetical protein
MLTLLLTATRPALESKVPTRLVCALHCYLICTDYFLKNAIIIAGDSSTGIEEVEKVIKGHPQISVMDSMKAAFDRLHEKLTLDQSFRHACHQQSGTSSFRTRSVGPRLHNAQGIPGGCI